MSEILSSHPCPICSTPVSHSPRYSLEVCRDCHNKACDAQGKFKNCNLALYYITYLFAQGNLMD